ncbi:MAG: hypothetical protein RIT35_1107 [Pseudomonadota bacterium]|jgi:hypothetical protein
MLEYTLTSLTENLPEFLLENDLIKDLGKGSIQLNKLVKKLLKQSQIENISDRNNRSVLESLVLTNSLENVLAKVMERSSVGVSLLTTLHKMQSLVFPN